MTHSTADNVANLTGTPWSIGFDNAKSLDKTPHIPPIKKPLLIKKHETIIHKFRIKIVFIVPAESDVNPCEKFATLLCLIIQQFPVTVLQPWNLSLIHISEPTRP
eukprot:15088218-Ditylum_brightwellii.AAC.1